MKFNPTVVFIVFLVFVAFVISAVIAMVHKELKVKPILTNFMISNLPWYKKKSAEFLIDKEYLKIAPPLTGRRIVSKTEANQRIKDTKQGIRNLEEETNENIRRDKFIRLNKLLIRDYYNTRSIAKDRYLLVDIKTTDFKYTYDHDHDYSAIGKYSSKQLVEVTVNASYSFIPIQQDKSYNNDTPGLDEKDFIFKFDGENWMVSNMIDFS